VSLVRSALIQRQGTASAKAKSEAWSIEHQQRTQLLSDDGEHARSLAEGRTDFGATHHEMQRLIATLPDETLAAKESWISGNSDFHYNEHIEMLQAYRKR